MIALTRSFQQATANMKEFLVDISWEIFEKFEWQLVSVTCKDKGGWSLAMHKLAKEAVNRMTNHLLAMKQFPPEGLNQEVYLRALLKGSASSVFKVHTTHLRFFLAQKMIEISAERLHI